MATVVKIGGSGSTVTAQTTIVASITANLAVGDIGFIVASIGSGKLATTVVDTKSNTWTLIKQPANGTSASCNVYYSIITTQLVAGTDTITMTWSGTTARRAWTVGKITGLTGAPLDLSASGTATGGTSVALTTSPSSTAQASEVVVSCYGAHQTTSAATTTFSVDAGYTALDTEDAGSGGTNEVSCFVEYKLVSSTGIQTGQPVANQANDIAGVIFTMKIAGGNINAGTAAHASAGYGPTLAGTGTGTIAPGVAAHASAAYGPTISGSGSATILAGAATHASAAYGPTLTEALAILAGVAARTATAYGPTVAASSGTTIAAGRAISAPVAFGPMAVSVAPQPYSPGAIISPMALFEPNDRPSGWKHPLRADEIDHSGDPTVLYSAAVGLDRLLDVGGYSPAWTASHGLVCIVRSPVAGYLRNLSVFIGATDAAANLELSVFDTGEATPGTYTKLYGSGAQSIALAAHWQPVVDPGAQVPVKQGQHLMLMCGSNSSTLTIAKTTTFPSSAMALPPTGLLVPSGGNLGKLCADIAAGYTAPVTISEAGMTVGTVIPLIVASILPNPS